MFTLMYTNNIVITLVNITINANLKLEVCVTTSDKPGQTDRLMSVYVGKKKNKPPKTLNIAQNQNLMI